MKTQTLLIASLALGITSGKAQFGRMAGPPPGPGLSGSTAKLFGENSTFSANLEMQTAGDGDADAMSMPGKMFFDTGKSRFEMDMSQMKGGKMPPQAAAQMKSMGMDKMIMIGRPDKKLGYQVFPNMQAYVENALPEQESASVPSDFKIEVTELGKETVDNHPCIKNKAVVTGKDGTKHESTVWNATDLKKFPIKIEQVESGTKITMLFHDVSLSKPAAELFEPPTGVTKYDSMQSMMQQVMMKRFGGGAPGR
jgi:chemotaxis protein CheY-P-specific phosphatase CheC